VHHRRLVGRLVGSTTWEEFDGECVTRELLDGQAILDDNVLRAPAGAYRAIAVRVFDPASSAWSIFWVDSRYPPSSIETPVVGGFAGNRGSFFADEELDGRPVRTRFIWHVDSRDSCRWEQAASSDGGHTWETNWYMNFERMVATSGAPEAPPSGIKHPMPASGVTNSTPAGHVEDFDFLVGRWTVRHRCLIRSVWQEFAGECVMQKVLGGQANLDENCWATSTGVSRALALRVFDPERRAWSIFWLDTQSPTTFGPPVIGGFDGTRGLFFGNDQLDGRPIRVRFDWFIGTLHACRWEQAFSFDAGATWETNWHMRFERAPVVAPGDAGHDA
jgi:hypothetical protein